MLSHRNRFHGHGSLRYVYNHGSKVRTKDLGLHYIENSKRTHSRFAIVVSKKVHKSAVKRNRVRRRLYEMVRHELPQIKTTHDFVITVFTPEVIEIEKDILAKQLRELLVKEKLIS